MQGSKASPEDMNSAIDEVVKKLKTKIENLDNNTLQQYKASMIAEVNKDDTNLLERSNSVWMEIANGSFEFDRKNNLISEINKASVTDVIQLFNQVFYNNVNKLSIQVKYVIKKFSYTETKRKFLKQTELKFIL